MNLRKVKIFGFKTFAEATSLDFPSGITAVVGPNGSGKSNLVDAFRWVLGETSNKSLRSGKLEDVIFAGNQKRKPLGLAEVAMTFDNSDRRLASDYSEVEITRRAYRAGESEYYINQTQVRLRDIVELLMGTGLGPGSYAIVSQGQIDSVLTSKPTDRRALFEETAGINKFLARKNESMRRLEQTEHNAIRINDLIAEIERRIPELDAQVRRAKRYRKLNARVRDLEILSYMRASVSRRAERESLRNELEKIDELRTIAAARAAQFGAFLAELRARAYQQELQLDELRARLQERRAHSGRIEADYAATLARREALEAQSTQTSQDADRVAEEREGLRATIASLEERIAPLADELDGARERELTAQSALAHARKNLDAIFTRLREVEATAAELAAREAERRVQSENSRVEAQRLESEAVAARERCERLEIGVGSATQKYTAREAQLASLALQLAHARESVDEAERTIAQSQEDLVRAVAQHREQTGEVKAAESRLHTIEELEASLEGHVPGTRAVVDAWQRGELGGIEGIVSNVIATDEKYARAMDVAFGARLSNIIVSRSEDGERAIEFLNQREAGRATFLPLDTLANRDAKQMTAELKAVSGAIGYAHELVRTDLKYEGVLRFLVGSVLVVDTLQTGIYLVRERRLHDTIVTLAGEQITGGGAITGGRFKREKSILARRAQGRSLRESLVGMRGKLDGFERAAFETTQRAEGATAARDVARDALAKVELQITEVRTEMVGLASDLERMNSEVAASRQVVTESIARAADSRQRERSYESQDPEHPSSGEERLHLEAELALARDEIAQTEAAQGDVTKRAADIRERASALAAQRDAANGRLGMLDQNSEHARDAREQMLAEIGSLVEATRALHAHLEGERRGVSDLDASLDVARRAREATAAQALQCESDGRVAANDERDAAAGGERHRTRLAQIEAELGMLVSGFAQNPATEEELHDVDVRYAREDDAIAEELPRLREELARLSANVNLNAEAEREDIGERNAFLRTQLDDLARARETLLQSIKEIEAQSQEQFNETFEKVSDAFAQMYERLFPGGLAKMWQTNPQSLSETGIEISVQPPGKKLMPLAALSGGERAMAAAALIFALIKVKPSPFYLLDEVDAALDDINVEHLSNMVRELATDSQMIIVTHNKKTMELADQMYGVTMREPGVSTVIAATLTAREPELVLA
ncbi:MAG: chromosome segregation protein SMC [Candidatus Eremiobacteraeota bacterium]|nr:chromosome segregation protein SMC [Candidatus Eremiobacteraeota bacterium]